MLVDEADRAILRLLKENARLSFRELARKTGLSVGTVISRIKRMEKLGIIKGYSVLVDPEKLGYDITAIIELTISQGELIQVEEMIAEKENVCGVYDVTGESDAIIIARFRNRMELSNFVKDLLKSKYIDRTVTHVVLSTAKEDFRVHL